MKLKKRNLTYVALCLAAIALIFAGYACDGGGIRPGGCSGSSSGGNNCDYVTCGDGSYSVTQDLRSGPANRSGLWYPNGNGPFPVFVWGCGGGSQPNAYVEHFNQLGSWGFIIIAQVSTGNGTELTNAMEWVIRQNGVRTSPLYQKVDTSKIAAGGHSLGSVSTFRIAADPRLSTTIHVAGGFGNSWGNNGGPSILVKPTAYINGANDQMGATDNARIDYRKTTVPVFWGVMSGVDHIMAARQGLPAITAWLLWHLNGETQHRAEFLESGGEFQTGMWDSQVKNW